MQTTSEPKRVLVIDDSEVMLARIKRALLAAGYDVITTTEIVGNARYLPICDLVLIDYHMPGLDGSAIVGSLRAVAHSAKKACPFFLYTSDQAVANAYVELGFDGVFTAKGDESALLRQISALFRTLAMRAEKERKLKLSTPP